MCVITATIVAVHENGPRCARDSGITTQYMNPYTSTPYSAPAAYTLLNKNPIFRLAM